MNRENSVTFHHIKSRGSGGSDDKNNLIPVCKTHHCEFHSKGNTFMCGKYTSVRLWFVDNGWDYNQFLHKWIHDNFNQV